MSPEPLRNPGVSQRTPEAACVRPHAYRVYISMRDDIKSQDVFLRTPLLGVGLRKGLASSCEHSKNLRESDQFGWVRPQAVVCGAQQ